MNPLVTAGSTMSPPFPGIISLANERATLTIFIRPDAPYLLASYSSLASPARSSRKPVTLRDGLHARTDGVDGPPTLGCSASLCRLTFVKLFPSPEIRANVTEKWCKNNAHCARAVHATLNRRTQGVRSATQHFRHPLVALNLR